MRLTMRWFGAGDPVRLAQLRQVPGVTGIVTALYDIPVGDAWPRSRLTQLGEAIDAAGLDFAVVESIPVHENIKLGRPTRDRLIANYCASIRAMGEVGVPVLCYNFMPVFDWLRTDLAFELDDRSTTLAFDESALAGIDLSHGTGDLPGWATGYSANQLHELRQAYAAVGPEQLWENLTYFLERVVPAAESAGVRLALHPDDPPWPILGFPRIITDGAALDRVVALVDSSANGITLCTGSLAASPANDVVDITRRLGGRGRIHFAHCRNVRVTGAHAFHETPHPTAYGDVDMSAVLRALCDSDFHGPMRPDHGRMIWNEQGRPGYGLYDRALGATYLHGLWEGITRGVLP
jgi:mannonate dehydratase